MKYRVEISTGPSQKNVLAAPPCDAHHRGNNVRRSRVNHHSPTYAKTDTFIGRFTPNGLTHCSHIFVMRQLIEAHVRECLRRQDSLAVQFTPTEQRLAERP